MTVGFALDLHGVHVEVDVPAELLDGIRRRLSYATDPIPRPAGAGVPGRPGTTALVIEVSAVAGDKYLVRRDGEDLLKVTAAGAIDCVETQIRQQVSMRSPEKIFLHAGVVAMEGRAAILPGVSHSGKTTLVKAMIGLGATYLSDEYAVLDRAGRVHPFTKLLSIRDAKGEPTLRAVQELGGTAADSPVPVRLVALCTYREDATWKPTRLSDGDAVLKLLRHTAQIQPRPADSLEALKRVVEGAAVLSGDRGPASEVAPFLLQTLVSTEQELGEP